MATNDSTPVTNVLVRHMVNAMRENLRARLLKALAPDLDLLLDELTKDMKVEAHRYFNANHFNDEVAILIQLPGVTDGRTPR